MARTNWSPNHIKFPGRRGYAVIEWCTNMGAFQKERVLLGLGGEAQGYREGRPGAVNRGRVLDEEQPRDGAPPLRD